MAISLSKGKKVSLKKTAPTLGEITVNLNWNSRPKNQGIFERFFGGGKAGIDLDLGCLYELKDGRKGAIQALGNSFGQYKESPFVSLDGDDRTGNSAAGETLRINGDMVSKIKRLLVYTFIYEGVASWQDADATVTIKYPGAEDLIVKMDSFDSDDTMCSLMLLENQGDETFSVEKTVKFHKGHRQMDDEFRWGLRWVHGTK